MSSAAAASIVLIHHQLVEATSSRIQDSIDIARIIESLDGLTHASRDVATVVFSCCTWGCHHPTTTAARVGWTIVVTIASGGGVDIPSSSSSSSSAIRRRLLLLIRLIIDSGILPIVEFLSLVLGHVVGVAHVKRLLGIVRGGRRVVVVATTTTTRSHHRRRRRIVAVVIVIDRVIGGVGGYGDDVGGIRDADAIVNDLAVFEVVGR